MEAVPLSHLKVFLAQLDLPVLAIFNNLTAPLFRKARRLVAESRMGTVSGTLTGIQSTLFFNNFICKHGQKTKGKKKHADSDVFLQVA